MTGEGKAALSVSAAMNLAKGKLESFTVTIIGEVSEVSSKSGYKAVYFTIKDKSASLPCLIWNNRYRDCGVDLRVGQLVQVTGKFSLWVQKGRMNFDAHTLSLAGEGNLRLQVANLAKKLEAEGLMNPARKKPLPPFPQTIGLVTSPRGAAVHDVLRTLRRRFPLALVVVAGVPVEGKQAPGALVDGIKMVYDAGAKVILVVRGGGSFEDLMPFNDERLARTIAACPTPIVTGIGHEPDTSIADMVADVRASTPTAAAEAVSPSRESLDARFAAWSEGMARAVTRRVALEEAHLDAVATRPVFADEMYLTGQYAQSLDMRAERLARALPVGIARDSAALAGLEDRMRKASSALVRTRADRLDVARERLKRDGAHLNVRFENRVSLVAARLEDLSPLKVLARGYAVARDANRDVVSKVGQVQKGDALRVLVSDGAIDCVVESTEPGSQAQRGGRTETN